MPVPKESPPSNINERAERIGKVAGWTACIGVLLDHSFPGGALRTIGQVLLAVGLLGILWMMVLLAMHYDATRRQARTPPGDRKP